MKVRNIALVTLAVTLIGLGGCTSLTEQCSTKVAYSNGLDDGMTPGADMNRNYAEACLPSKQQALNAAYAEGYKAGVPQRPAVAKQTRKLIDNSRD